MIASVMDIEARLPIRCARCKRQVDRAWTVAKIDGRLRFVVECHGAVTRFEFDPPSIADGQEETRRWLDRVLRDLDDAFKPPPQFRIRTCPRRHQAEARR